MGKRTAAVDEAPIRLEVNGRAVAVWTCSPERRQALAVGRLMADGYLEPTDAPPDFERTDEDGVATLCTRLSQQHAARADAVRRHREERGCGILHYVHCAPEAIRGRAGALPLPSRDVLGRLFQDLYASEGYRDRGGLHAAALSDGERLFFQVEEVGRHNAVDKAVGAALLEGSRPTEFGLVLTARVSAEIALKAARAGLSWIASRSVPTTLALRIAGTAGLPIVARAASPEPKVYR